MTFFEYYKQQFKDVKEVWALARKSKNWPAFVAAMFCLFNPSMVYMMYLYDTGIMEAAKGSTRKGKRRIRAPTTTSVFGGGCQI